MHWPLAALALGPALLNVGIVAYALRRLPRTGLTYLFVIFVTALATWQLSEGLMRLSGDAASAALWADLLALGSLAIAPVGLHFALLYVGHEKLARSPFVIALLYGPMVLIELASRAGFNDAPYSYDPTWGWVSTLPAPPLARFTGFWVAGLAIAMVLVLARYAWTRAPEDPTKNAATLVAAGFALPTLQGTITQVLFPIVLGIPGLPIASTTMTFFSVLTLIALRQHHFLQATTWEERAARAERRLHQQVRMLTQAEGIAGIGSWERDLVTGRMECSDQFYRIFGQDPGVTSVTFEAAMAQVHPDDSQRLQAAIVRDLDAARALYTSTGDREYAGEKIEYRVRLPDGRERLVRAQGRILLDEAGRPQRSLGTVQDVTDQRRSDEAYRRSYEKEQEILRLRKTDEFKTRFINMAAHELNTPLTPIRLQLHLIKTLHGQHSDDPQLHASLDILDRNVERLTHLVQDILDASRLQAGKLRIAPRVLDVAGTIQEAVDSFGETALKAGLSLDVRLTPGLHVRADPGRLAQVLYNLLNNAIKFTPSGGRVTVESRLVNGGVRVRVSDTGAGIAPTDLARLFQAFTQLENQGAATGGTGLGLYITKGIVEDHGGRVWAESAGLGHGTTFNIELPAETTPREERPVAVARPRRPAGDLEDRLRQLL